MCVERSERIFFFTKKNQKTFFYDNAWRIVQTGRNKKTNIYSNFLTIKWISKNENTKHKNNIYIYLFVFFKYYKFVYKNERGTQTLSTDVYKVHTYCVFLRTHMYSMYVICEYTCCILIQLKLYN